MQAPSNNHNSFDEVTFKKLLDNLNTSVIWLTQDLRIIYLNHATEALFEVSSKHIIGDKLSVLIHQNNTALETLVTEGVKGNPLTEREATLTLKSGQRIIVDCAITPIHDSDSQTLLIELQSIDRLLKISREENLLSTQSSTRKLIRGLAHEIKNPLGGIRGAAQLLAKQSEEAADFTTIIIEEADRLRNLVDTMLGPNKKPVRDSVNIHEVLDRVIQLICAETNESIGIRRDFDPSIPELIGDKEQLIQAALNISRNAMQALQEHHITEPMLSYKTRIIRQHTISDKRHKLVCAVNITDNGPGIPKDIINELFFPMVSGRAEGTGLGLSISQSIAQRHGGLIECQSEPGRTCFTLYLPLEY